MRTERQPFPHIPIPHAGVGLHPQRLDSVGGGGCEARFPASLSLGVHGRGRGRAQGRGRGRDAGCGRGSAGNDGGAGAGSHSGRGGRGGRNSGGPSACVFPTESRILQSPHTKAVLKRLSEQNSAARLEEASDIWAAMEARKEEKREGKGRKRAPNKDARTGGACDGIGGMNRPYFGPPPLSCLEGDSSLHFPDKYFYSLGRGWNKASLYNPGPNHERSWPICRVIPPLG